MARIVKLFVYPKGTAYEVTGREVQVPQINCLHGDLDTVDVHITEEDWLEVGKSIVPAPTPPARQIMNMVNTGPWLALRMWIDSLEECGANENSLAGLNWLLRHRKMPEAITQEKVPGEFYRWLDPHRDNAFTMCHLPAVVCNAMVLGNENEARSRRISLAAALAKHKSLKVYSTLQEAYTDAAYGVALAITHLATFGHHSRELINTRDGFASIGEVFNG